MLWLPFAFVAHLTQFVDVGWQYLTMERGVGNLTGNGSYIALTSPDQRDLTIVLQTMVSRTMISILDFNLTNKGALKSLTESDKLLKLQLH